VAERWAQMEGRCQYPTFVCRRGSIDWHVDDCLGRPREGRLPHAGHQLLIEGQVSSGPRVLGATLPHSKQKFTGAVAQPSTPLRLGGAGEAKEGVHLARVVDKQN